MQGLVVAGHKGTVRRSERVATPKNRVERAVWEALHGSIAPGALVTYGHLDDELNALRSDLQCRGLIRRGLPTKSWLPSRTHAGQQLLADAMSEYPWPSPAPRSYELSTSTLGLFVALYGNRALREILPRFAADSGLLDHASRDPAAAMMISNPRSDSGGMPNM